MGSPRARHRRFMIRFSLTLLAAALVAAPAFAEPLVPAMAAPAVMAPAVLQQPDAGAGLLFAQAEGLPLEQIIAGIRAQFPGELSDVETRPSYGGAPIYVVKWIAPGNRIMIITVDGATGDIIEVR